MLAQRRRRTDILCMPAERMCPICGKPAAEEVRPFCSPRCRDVDLHRWLSDVYAIPVKEEEDEDGTSSPDAPAD